MIDANFNRAREALRVMEDAARFVLEDGALCGELKSIRHGLVEVIAGAGPAREDLLASRDTPGDIGTTIAGDGEGARAGLRDVVAAAGARLGEAMRVLEECLKAWEGAEGWGRGESSEFKVQSSNEGGRKDDAETRAWGRVEGLRYRVYEAERRLGLALGGGRAPRWRLCVLVTESLCRRSWEDVVRAAVAGGAGGIQIREKELSDREVIRRARRVVEIRQEAVERPERKVESGKWKVERPTWGYPSVIVNDRPDLAVLAGADGVHLGQQDVSAAGARRIVGAKLLIGISTENLDQARAAAREGADYCGVGPMFATATKDKPRIAGPAYLRDYLADPVASRLPHLAIGGVTPENIAELVAAGCTGVAVSSCVCGADDPELVCRELIRRLVAAEPPALASRA